MSKEKERRATTEVLKGEKSAPAQKNEQRGKGFIEELLRSIKIQALWRRAEQNNDAVSLSRLTRIEEGLKSSDVNIKKTAEDDWNDLLQQRARVQEDVEKPLSTIVRRVVSGKDKNNLSARAKALENKINTFSGGEKDGSLLVAELDQLASELGVISNVDGIKEIEERIEMLQIQMQIRPQIEDPLHTRSVIPTEKAREFGEKNNERDLFRVRRAVNTKIDQEETQKRWDRFLSKIRKEVVPDDKSELEKLSGQELVDRLSDVGYWQMNGDVFADTKLKLKLAGKQIREQRQLLEMVEATYLGALERKIKQDAGDKVGENFSEGFGVAMKKRRKYRRNFYQFGKKKPDDDKESQYKNLIRDVVKEATKRKGIIPALTQGLGGAESMDELTRRQQQMLLERNQFDFQQAENNQRLLSERIRQSSELLKKVGLNISDLSDFNLRAEKLKQANEKLRGLTGVESDERLNIVQMLHDLERFGAVDSMREMNELLAHGHYSAFMVKLEAYIDRVGLKESSSDWQFAIMLRNAKDTISGFNSDLGGKFDLWQEGQFIPGITDVDEETFIKMIPRVLHPSRLNYELNAKYSNWVSMQVEAQGRKVNISSAAILQMLESEEVGKRVMDAQVNGNEGVMYQLLVEHLYGKDAKLDILPGGKSGETLFRIMKDGKILVDVNDKIKINYFEIVEGSNKVDHSEELNIKQLLEQSSSMTNYAKKMWWWTGDWERFVADYDNDHLSQANKRLMSIGASFRDYSLEFGKIHPVFEELTKLGVLLPPFGTYKKSDMVVKHIMHAFVDNDIADAKRGEIVGKAINNMIFRTVRISDTGNEYLTGKRTLEEIRLLADLPTSDEESWNWWLSIQRGMKRSGLKSYSEIQDMLSIAEAKRSDQQMAWTVQFNEVLETIKELKGVRSNIDSLGLTAEELRPLMRTQSMHMTGDYHAGGETVDNFLRNFEFSSVVNYDEREKGTDHIDYANYFAAKREVASMLPKIMRGGMPSMDQLKELFDKLTGYVNPPADKLKWFQDFMVRWTKFRTWQWKEYDIAMTDREDWEAQKARGLEVSKEPPVGYATATYKIKDERGDTWNVRGRDGMRVTKKRKARFNEAWTKYKIPMLRIGDIEPLMTFMTANGMLPTPEMGEEIIGRAFGVTEPLHILEKVYHDRTGKHLPRWMHTAGHLANKVTYLIRKHPLFDDPVWAFWSISAELWEYISEVGKDITKEAVGGHH